MATTPAPRLDGALPLVLDGQSDGVVVNIVLPRPGKLLRAKLRLRAQSTAESLITLDAGASSKLDGAQALRWASAIWQEERAIVALQVVANAPLPDDGQCGVRARALSLSSWQILSPIDSLTLEALPSAPGGPIESQVTTTLRFPAMAANQLLLEMLNENKFDGKLSGVLVPGSVKLASISVTATAQPCHVALSVDTALPFFSVAGPLPGRAISVEGLVPVLNRYLAQNPASLTIPLVLRAQGKGQICIESFVAEQVAEPDPTQAATTPTGSPRIEAIWLDQTATTPLDPPRIETIWPQPGMSPEQQNAQLARPQYRIAQCFTALPAATALSRLALLLRATSPEVLAQLSLYPDQQGRPGQNPLPLLPPMPLNFAARPDDAPAWLQHTLASVARLPAAPWWLVLEVLSGEALWYVGSQQVPPEALGILTQYHGGEWLPAAASAPCWGQSLINLVTLDTP